ncbi:IpaC/SipC family type III secretion system effector [Iodobacter fluviatilis]|uniref:Effector protein BipC n=1 Tax=Iodobacter fluviatilis TaxID=537 RepID=A0A377Q4I7_9NEIS|nr:IpaC/SipC family type III secretion system effector [Iodobacter fluviatilis]TCU80255.1 IpaC/SipC-like invasin protein C [Iodobacter fluviatilis]STQ90144.1 pathogenicity island 1 effector protein SipC [Iodobacter fluviatilis]
MTTAISAAKSSPVFSTSAAVLKSVADVKGTAEGKKLSAGFEEKAAALPHAVPRSSIMAGAPDLRAPELSLDGAATKQVFDALDAVVEAPQDESFALHTLFSSDKMRGVPMDSDLLLALIVQLKALQLEQSASERNLGGKLTVLSFDGSKASADSQRLSGSAALGTAISSAAVSIGFAGVSLGKGVKAHQTHKNSLINNQGKANGLKLEVEKNQLRLSQHPEMPPRTKATLSKESASKMHMVRSHEEAHQLEVSRAGKLSGQAQVIATLPVGTLVDGAGQTVQKNEDALRTMVDAGVNVINQASKNADDVGNGSLDLAKQLQAMLRDYVQSKRDAFAAVASKI